MLSDFTNQLLVVLIVLAAIPNDQAALVFCIFVLFYNLSEICRACRVFLSRHNISKNLPWISSEGIRSI